MSTELKNCRFDMFAHLAKNCEYCIKDVFLAVWMMCNIYKWQNE